MHKESMRPWRVEGKARIQHARTKKSYEIEKDQIELEQIDSSENSMGPDCLYEARLDHPELGWIVWTLREYPIGVLDHENVDVGPHTLEKNFIFSYDHERET